MKTIRFITILLIVIGALNWGLWGFFKLDLIAAITGSSVNILARFIYALVGIAGAYSLILFINGCLCVENCTCRKDKP